MPKRQRHTSESLRISGRIFRLSVKIHRTTGGCNGGAHNECDGRVETVEALKEALTEEGEGLPVTKNRGS